MQPKILIIDDEFHIRMLIEQTLEELADNAGIELLKAADGEEGLRLIRSERPALVFLDVMMPKKNGFEVCRTVKKEWDMDRVYIVMLTAKGQQFDFEKGRSVGADMYITKPFDPDALLAKAREVLNLA